MLIFPQRQARRQQPGKRPALPLPEHQRQLRPQIHGPEPGQQRKAEQRQQRPAPGHVPAQHGPFRCTGGKPAVQQGHSEGGDAHRQRPGKQQRHPEIPGAQVHLNLCQQHRWAHLHQNLRQRHKAQRGGKIHRNIHARGPQPEPPAMAGVVPLQIGPVAKVGQIHRVAHQQRRKGGQQIKQQPAAQRPCQRHQQRHVRVAPASFP